MRWQQLSEISVNDFLLKQKDFLLEKRVNDELEWQGLTDIRAEFYGAPESRETIRKGAKLINEYLEAGWELNPTEEEMEIQEEPDDHITTPASLLKSHNLPADKWKVFLSSTKHVLQAH